MIRNEMKYCISRRGIGLLKDDLSAKEQEYIRNELTVKAYVPPTAIQKSSSFPIYRESDKKIYVPRFFAQKKYNIKYPLNKYNSLENLTFNGDLRPYQENIIRVFMNETKKSGCGLLEIPCGRGKCLGRNTPIMMYNGLIKYVQDINENDCLVGDDGCIRYVTGVVSGKSKMYTIEQTNGITYRVNDVHILTLFDTLMKTIVDIDVQTFIKNGSSRYRGIKRDIKKTRIYTFSKIRITPEIHEDDYYGFVINKNRRFLLGDGTITHNTVMALNIVTQLNVRTLVIVHKEFLLEQWIERIAQFIPNAKIGRIQGKCIDIEGKDIVIGMLQSLSMKEYDRSLFDTFGFTIVDECHHICAEVFSNSLFKIVTPYMLGLSATMERKDKLSSVFKLFIGDVIYKEENSMTDIVTVRCVQYSNTDPCYIETLYNMKGQTHYSLMIKKISEFMERTQFIIRILGDIIDEEPSQQIMILSHNKSLLKDLYENIDNNVGYYVGGMKKDKLKDSETKKVILATYAMASEALDIKTLSVVILATPKTDIRQSVGRILRQKHKHPLVVDIVDQHTMFQNQWRKRRAYYNKCNYVISEIDSANYHTDFKKWNTKQKKKNKLLQQVCYV